MAEEKKEIWTPSKSLALAKQSCIYCFGLGMRQGRGGKNSVCNCVLRAVFRACLHKFRHVTKTVVHVSHSTFENTGHTTGKGMRWGMKNAEFAADFVLMAERVLSEEEHRLFRCHFILGADWRAYCGRYNVDRGLFYHAVYRIEQRMGLALSETEPYPLWPIDEYFTDTPTGQMVPSLVHEKKSRKNSARPKILKSVA